MWCRPGHTNVVSSMYTVSHVFLQRLLCLCHYNKQGAFHLYHGTWPLISQGCHEFHINNLGVTISDPVPVDIVHNHRLLSGMCTMYEELDTTTMQKVTRIQIALLVGATHISTFSCISVTKLLRTKLSSSCWFAMGSQIVNHCRITVNELDY